MSVVTVIARWKIKSAQVDTVLKLLPQLIAASKDEPGNICYDHYSRPESPGEILLFEQYRDQAAFDAHRATAHFIDLAVKKIVPHLETRSVDVFVNPGT